jgi:hypothetical protein
MPNAGNNHSRKGAVANKAERQVRAYELSLAGHTLREAAAIMSAEGARISHEGVRSLISLEAAERVSPKAEEYRTLLIERLNAERLVVLSMLDVMPAPVTAGKDGFVVRDPETQEVVRDYSLHLSAIDRLVKIDVQLAKLTGAEAPSESVVTANVTTMPPAVAELMAQAQQRVAAERAELSGGE